MDLCASANRTTERTGVHDLRWIVVSEHRALGDVLVVQSQLEVQSHEVGRIRWHHALRKRVANHLGSYFAKLVPNAEGVIPVIDVSGPVKRHEATAFESDVGAASHRTEVWLKLLNHRLVVVPVVKPL